MGERISGVYRIINMLTGKSYVGSSLNARVRLAEHRSTLRRGVNRCLKLQRAWNLYGESAFQCSLMLRCAPNDLLFYEQRAIDHFDACRRGYNAFPRADITDPVAVSASLRGNQRRKGIAHRQEDRERISHGLRRYFAANPEARRASAAHLRGCDSSRAKGYKYTPEQRAQRSQQQRARFQNDPTLGPRFSAASRATALSKGHCRKGHAYVAANIYWYRGTRKCRTCARVAQLRYRPKKGRT